MPVAPHPSAWRVRLPWQPAQPPSRKIKAQLDSHHDVGVPLGGVGAGAINRGLNGGFNRWTVKAGQVDYFTHPANGFALWQRPADGPATARALRPDEPGIEGWRFDPTGDCAALFPKTWHSYSEGALRLVLEQISPVVPGLEDDLDLPCGLFRAHLENSGETPLDVAVLFSFANMVGWFSGFRGIGHPGGVAGQRNEELNGSSLRGVVMTRDVAEPGEGDGEMLIGLRPAEALDITACPAFDPARGGAALWAAFAAEGRVPAGKPWTSGGGFSEFPAAQPCAALAARCPLAPCEARTIDFVLAWDLPVIRFGQGRRWHRHYTARWGASGSNAAAIAAHALDSADHWSRTIDAFHDTAAARLGPTATPLAINELYMLTEGLTVWTAPTADHPAHFGLIECPDYPLYNTLDLWVYAADAVADLFPALAALVVDDYAAEVAKEDPETRAHLKSGALFPRQRAAMLPHDLGAPAADPFVRANDYTYQDSARWKDLNAMFALTAWRSVRDDPALAGRWLAQVTQAMQALLQYDRDGDGLIENEGFPDQTFDNVPLKGVSAYCAGLWLAALRATAALADAADAAAEAARWRALSERAEPAFEAALWSGTHFRVDSAGRFRDAVFAEQLYGPATARMLGLGDVVETGKARTALATIYTRNFLEAGRGRGLIAITSATQDSTLYAPKGEQGLQWDEILLGFNYSFAAQLTVYGMETEAETLLRALSETLGPERGLHFRTPAALHPTQPLYRAQMNLRPLGAWAIALARDVAARADQRKG